MPPPCFKILCVSELYVQTYDHGTVSSCEDAVCRDDLEVEKCCVHKSYM